MSATPNSIRFRDKLSLLDRALDATYRRFWSGTELADRYRAYAIQLHQIIRASVPLMAAARACAAGRAEQDTVCAALIPYLDAHIAEEHDHDLWLLDDLEVAGVPRSDVLARIPSPRVAGLVGAQYYWIWHHHPVALLGYIAVLEGSPPSESFFEALRDRTALPDAAFRTMRKHGEVDPGHKEELDRFLDSLPLSATHERLLGVSLVHTTSALGACVEELMLRG
jgi:hypothetical protein